MTPIQDMEIFARVVTAGSMTAASRELGISPAVVSKRIRRMEERLGSRLLQRTTRRLATTETGQGYYERVVAILASVEEAENFIARRNAAPKGMLKVTAPTSFGRMHIAPYIGEFLAANPELQLSLDLSDQLVDLVGEGFDVAIRIGELEDSSLVARRLAPNNRVICAAPGYLQQHGAPTTLADLPRHNCLAAINQDLWRLEGPEGPINVRVSGNIHTNSSEVVREAVLTGVGIALRSTWDVGPALKAGKLKVILPQYRSSRRVALFAVYPSRRFLPLKVRVFIDYLAGIYGPEPYWDAGLGLPRLSCVSG
ncbi:MAG: LysR family transcriptional regulator [Hyphomicrobiales bacterium]|nr:LysR family transcriptional regulator [Hyphomicrobiales bacterium]